MSDEVVSTISKGIDITRACMEIVLAKAPIGDRTAIENLKQVIHQQALMANDSEESVAIRILFATYMEYLAYLDETSPLKVGSRAIKQEDN